MGKNIFSETSPSTSFLYSSSKVNFIEPLTLQVTFKRNEGRNCAAPCITSSQKDVLTRGFVKDTMIDGSKIAILHFDWTGVFSFLKNNSRAIQNRSSNLIKTHSCKCFFPNAHCVIYIHAVEYYVIPFLNLIHACTDVMTLIGNLNCLF